MCHVKKSVYQHQSVEHAYHLQRLKYISPMTIELEWERLLIT